MRTIRCGYVAIMASALVGCASITVSKVTKTNPNVSGIRYSLPKPFIQVLPQADDTILVSVVYLPDSDHTYAIATDSTMSSYSYQVTINQNGTLSAIEFKQETSIVGQQLAASAATAATQVYNIRTAEALANQTSINNAQTSVDAAQSTYDAAAAQVESDIAHGVAGTQLNTDKATEAAKLALLGDAKAVLGRVKSNSQVASYTAAPSAPITTTNPSPTTGTNSGFGPQTWNGPTEYELPDKYGAVLYAVNEHLDPAGNPVVSLEASKLNGEKQPEFETATIALPAPTLRPSNQAVPQASSTVLFQFSRSVLLVSQCDVFTTGDSKVTGNAKCDFTDKSDSSDHKSVTLTLPAPRLPVGTYKLNMGYSYQTSLNATAKSEQATVLFSLQ